MISSQIIWNPNDILSYKDEWDALYAHNINEPSTSFSWTYALFKNHIREHDTFFIIRLHTNNTTICFIPMVASSEKLLGMNLITIYFASERYNTHSDILSNLKNSELISTLLESLSELPVKWDICRTTRLLEDSKYLKHIEDAISTFYPAYTVRHEQPSYFLKLPESFDKYLEQRSGKFRNYLKRMTKKLEKSGAVNYSKLGTNDDFEKAFNTIIDIESASWKQSHGTSITAIDHQKSFYKTLCHKEHHANRLHLCFLCVNNNPIAYNMGLISHGTYYYLKTSYNSDFRSSSPSTILRAHLIASLITDKVQYFDFPGEPYEWEQQWTSTLRWHKSIVFFNNSIKARFFSILSTWKRKIKRQHDEKKLLFCNPRTLEASTNK